MENMEYNTEKDRLVISQYGRNVQNLINYAKEVEDKETRQKYAERIVELMYQMNPENKNMNNYRAKLWSHLLKIADYDIDIVAPEDAILAKEDVVKPEVMDYPKGVKRYRHYGGNVSSLIKRAIEMEDGPKKDAFAETIARYMKLAYRTWNRQHYVSDELIIEDLEKMSGGKLKLAENYNLNIGKDDRDNQPRRHSNNHRKNNHRKNNNRYSNNRNKKRR